MSTLDIEPSDVVRLLEQYLKENNLLRTLQTLQEETSVNLNTVDSIETFVNDINAGHWDVVLKVVKLLKLPDNKLIDLYEQIAIELIELRETRAAKWLIQKTEPMQKLKASSPDRYLHLQNLSLNASFDYSKAYKDGSKERRRNAIATALKKEVTVVPPERLLNLLGDALKWQRHEGLLPSGSSIDIFTGKAHMVAAEVETHPNILHKHCIKPVNDNEKPIMVCCAEFSLDGQYLVVGYSTGVVEIRNSTTGRLANDLAWQRTKPIITPRKDSAALALCFSTSDLLAVGDSDGHISIWKLETGQLIQKFESVHNERGISCLLFHRNGKEILSGGIDAAVKLNGMRSNKTIRDFRGHTSFVTSICFSKDDNHILSGSADRTIRIWNAKTAQIEKVYKANSKIHTLLPMTHLKNDRFLVAGRSNIIDIIEMIDNDNEKVRLKEELKIEEIKSEDTVDEEAPKPVPNFYSTCLSPRGNWIYAVDSQNIYCLNYSTKKVHKKLISHEEESNDLIGVKHHPLLNLLATFDTKGNLKLWKP